MFPSLFIKMISSIGEDKVSADKESGWFGWFIRVNIRKTSRKFDILIDNYANSIVCVGF